MKRSTFQGPDYVWLALFRFVLLGDFEPNLPEEYPLDTIELLATVQEGGISVKYTVVLHALIN